MALELIQIIEDGQDQARVMDQILRKASFRTNVAFDGPTGIQDIWRLKPALVLLDLILPGMGGKEICGRLRTDPQTKTMGIVFVTAMTAEDHKIAALECGADDVISKPYSSRELVARVRTVLRRIALEAPQPDEDAENDVVLEEMHYVVSFRGRRVSLTKAEWIVLGRLARTPGKVVPREELRAALWGEDGLSHDRELDLTIQHLDRKLSGDGGAPDLITGVQGTGYRLTRNPVALPLSA